jgi:hypothetical protein
VDIILLTIEGALHRPNFAFKVFRSLPMRYITEEIFSANTGSNAGRSALLAEFDGGKLLLGIPTAEVGTARLVVQSFDPERDIFYRSPEKLTPEELSEEIAIHLPESLRARMKERVAASSIGDLVLMQYVPSQVHSISPLAALEEILHAVGDVNSAILQADNGGLLFVRKAGSDIRAHASTHSLKEFLNLDHTERETIFPDFHASEIILSGSDIDHFENFNLGERLETARRISIADFATLCDFTEEAAILVDLNPHRYTLTIGTAYVLSSILSE